MRVVSARWVIPIARPPIADGAVALADDGAVLAVGSRAELRAEFPDAPEERAEGVLLPGLVNAHSHLELPRTPTPSPAGRVSSRGRRCSCGARAATRPTAARPGRDRRDRRRGAGDRRHRRRGQLAGGCARHRRAGLAGVLFHSAVKLLSARWVVPVSRPPIDEGAVALADDGAVLAAGGRAELRAEFPDAAEERAEGVLLPGLVNAHSHLELSGHADGVPGGQGLFAWATTLMRVRSADTAAQQREAAATAAAAAVTFGTAAVGDVGSSLAAAPGIGRAGLTGVLFHELFGSREMATGDPRLHASPRAQAKQIFRR